MECRASLIYAYLLMPGVDHNGGTTGQLQTVLAAVSVMLLWQLLIAFMTAAG